MNDITESPPYDRPKLLPRLGALGIVNFLTTAIAHSPISSFGITLVGMVLALVICGYLGLVILKTRDSMLALHRLHPSDLWICRRSGALAVGLAVALLVGLDILVAYDVAPSDIGVESSWGMALVGFVMEIGVVLSAACLWAPRSLQHTKPLILWKILAAPLLLVYGLYVVLLLLLPAASMLFQRATDHPLI